MPAPSSLPCWALHPGVCRSPRVDPVLGWHHLRQGAETSGLQLGRCHSGAGVRQPQSPVPHGRDPVRQRSPLFHVRWEARSLTQVAQTKGTEPRSRGTTQPGSPRQPCGGPVSWCDYQQPLPPQDHPSLGNKAQEPCRSDQGCGTRGPSDSSTLRSCVTGSLPSLDNPGPRLIGPAPLFSKQHTQALQDRRV